MAEHRWYGPGRHFVNLAPDDVHNPGAVRLCNPFVGYDEAPAQVGDNDGPARVRGSGGNDGGGSSSGHTARSEFLWTHEIPNVARACVEEGDTRDLHEHKDDEDDEDEDEEEEEEEEAEGKTANCAKLPYDSDAVPAVFDQLKFALETRSALPQTLILFAARFSRFRSFSLSSPAALFPARCLAFRSLAFLFLTALWAGPPFSWGVTSVVQREGFSPISWWCNTQEI